MKKILKYALLLALVAVLLFFAFRGVNWKDFVDGLKSCRWEWIIGTIAVMWIITWLRGNRWRIQLEPVQTGDRKITRRETYDAYAICYLSNIVFPRSGEVVRCGLLAETKKTTFEGALGTVVIERTWDLLCMVLAVVPLLFFGRFRDFLVEKMFRPAAGSMGIGWFWIVVIFVAVLVAAIFLVRAYRERIARSKAGAAFLKFFKGLGSGIAAAFKMDHKFAFFAYTLLIWVGYWLTSLMTIRAFPSADSLTGLDALFLMVVGALGWVVPVQGGFGAYHFIVSMTLVPIYGFEKSTGLIFATLSHESQIVQMLLCGLISLVSWYFYRRKLKQNALQ
ncbi:MAG: flippase-like domain-containing protein [Bacteroidales bacterium]|nr:flippase-like domain-containing protein [Bacteroidales bacterium]